MPTATVPRDGECHAGRGGRAGTGAPREMSRRAEPLRGPMAEDRAFPTLTAAQIARVAAHGRRRRVARGDGTRSQRRRRSGRFELAEARRSGGRRVPRPGRRLIQSTTASRGDRHDVRSAPCHRLFHGRSDSFSRDSCFSSARDFSGSPCSPHSRDGVERTRELFELSQPLVYRHTADMMALGADIRAQAEERRRIGFRSRGVAAE